MWGAIAKAVLPAVAARLIGGGRPKPPRPVVTSTRQEYDFARLAAEARKAGFNPLTALASGVSTGATQTAFPPLASERYLGESLGETFSTLFGNQSKDLHGPWGKSLEEILVIDEGGYGIPPQGGGHRGFSSTQAPGSTGYGRSYSYTPVGMGGPSGTVVPHDQAERGSSHSLNSDRETVALGDYYGGGFTDRDEYLPAGKKPEIRRDNTNIILGSGRADGQDYLGVNPELFESSPGEIAGGLILHGFDTVSDAFGEHSNGGGAVGTLAEGGAWIGNGISNAYNFVTGSRPSETVANMRVTRQLRECRDGDMVSCSIHGIKPDEAEGLLASRRSEAHQRNRSKYFPGMDPESVARRRERFLSTSRQSERKSGSFKTIPNAPRTVSGTGSHPRRRRR